MTDKLIIEIADQGADEAIRKLDALKVAAVSLGKELTALKSGSSALKELKSALAGTKQGATAIEELGAAMKQLNISTNSVKSTLSASIRGLGTILKSEMNQLREVVQESGTGIGKGIGAGITAGTPQAVNAVKRQGQTIAAAAKAEATRIYEAMVSGQANAKIKDPGVLFDLQKAGATLSPYHKQVLENWKSSSNIARNGIKAELAKDRTATENAVKAETALLQNALKAMEERSNLRDSSIAGIYKQSLARGKSNVAQVKAQLKAEADDIIAAQKTELARIQAQVTAAMNNAQGSYSRIGASGLRGATINPQIQPVPPVRTAISSAASAVLSGGPKPAEIDSMSAAMKRLEVSGNDVHSMSRGLASGFGALWLTWGNLLPLFAGAAISNGFMKTAKEGLQVAHTLETIAVLGENTGSEIVQLTNEMIDLGNTGIHGPIAVAEAMKTLSLAGLKAADILAVTRDTMNFSMAGATDIQTAADVLVSVTTAFGTGAAGFSRSADIIMRAAADSKASVESFGEAMKTASVVGEQYGAKQEDVALQIQYLANLGIQGTAAGTAIRNMYADITGRSGQVTKILKSMGLDFKDAAGNVLGLEDMTKQLMGTLSQYDAKSQGAILQALFGERGAKSMIATMAAANTFVMDESGKMVSKLVMDQKKLEDSYGESAIAAIKMGQTSSNAFKAASATLETTLFQAFTAMEPQLYSVATSIKKAFGSPELLASLSTLVGSVATFTQLLVENIGTVVKMGLAYAGFKAAIAATASAYGIYQGIITAVSASKAILTARTAAQTAADMAGARALGIRSAAELSSAQASAAGAAAGAKNLTVLGGLLRILPGVGTAIMLAASAWQLYSMWSKRAANSTQTYTDEKSKTVVENLKAEATQVNKLTDLRRKGMTQAEAEAELRTQNSKHDALATAQEVANLATVQAAKAKGAAAALDIDLRAERSAPTGANTRAMIQARDENLAAAARYEAQAKTALDGGKLNAAAIDSAAAEVKAAHKSAFEQGEKERLKQKEIDDANLAAAFPTKGSKSWDLASFQQESGSGFGRSKGAKGKGADRASEPNFVPFDNRIKEIEKASNKELASLRSLAANSQKILDAKHQAGILSEGEYQAELIASVSASESEQLAELNSSAMQFAIAHASKMSSLEEALSKAVNANDAAGIAKFKQEIENAGNTSATFFEGISNSIDTIKSDSLTRVAIAAIKAEGAIKKAADSSRDFWKKDQEEAQKLKALDQIEEKYKNIDESVLSTDVASKAAALARVSAVEKYNSQLATMEINVKEARDALRDFQALAKARVLLGADATEVAAAEAKLRGTHESLVLLKEEASQSAVIAIEDASMQAFAKARQAQIDELRNGLSDAVYASIFEGGKAGGKKFIEVLRKELLQRPLMVIINGVMGNIVGSLMGGSDIMGGMGGGAGGVGGWVNGAKTAYDIYSMGSKAATWLGFGSAAAGAGASIGLSAGAAGVTGLTGSVAGAGYGFASGAASLGMTAGSAGASAIGGSLGAGAAGAGAAGAGAAAGGFGSMAAAAGPWIAGAIALYSIIKSFDDSGTLHMGAGAVYNGKDGLKGGADLYGQAAFGMGAKGEYNAAAQANVDSIAQALGMALDGVAVGFGQKAGYEIATAFADDSSKDGAWGSLRISKDGSDLLNWEDTRKSKWAPKEFSDGEGGYKEYLAAVAKDTRQVLLDMDLPSWADTMLNSIGEAASMDQLAGTIAQIGQIQTAFVMLGTTIDGFAGMADKTFEALMKASGGFASLQQNLGTYYENFYTEAERMGKATASLAAELAKSGVSMPASKEAYRTLVEQQLAAGEGGAELAAKLLALSGAFAEVADYANEAARAAVGAKEQSDAIYNLQVGGLKAQGNGLLAVAMERRRELAEMAKFGPAAQQMQRDIWAALDATDARDAAWAGVQASVGREKDYWAKIVSASQQAIGQLQSVFDLMASGAKDLYGTVQQTLDAQAQQGMDYLQTALKGMRSGKSAAGFAGLQDASAAARAGVNGAQYASQFDSDRERLRLAGIMGEIGTLTGVQLSAQERTLKAAQTQVEQLDDTLDYWRKQIDLATNGVVATLGVGDAVQMLAAALAKSNANNPISAASNGTPADKAALYNYYLSNGFSDADIRAQVTKTSGAQTQSDWDYLRKLAGIPGFAVGTNFVPQDMLAQVHQGERIIPAADNRALMQAMEGGNGERLERLVEGLTAEVQRLQAIVAEGVMYQRDTAGILDNVTEGGNAMRTGATI